MKEVRTLDRYKIEHGFADVSPLPLIPILAKKSTIRDTRTGRTIEALDWHSWQASDRKAMEKLKNER